MRKTTSVMVHSLLDQHDQQGKAYLQLNSEEAAGEVVSSQFLPEAIPTDTLSVSAGHLAQPVSLFVSLANIN